MTGLATFRVVGRKSELRGDIPASHMGSRSTTPLLRNPMEVRRCSQHAGANVDFGDEGAVDWAFLGNLKQLRALLLSYPPREFEVALDVVQAFLLWFRNRRSRLRESYCGAA